MIEIKTDGSRERQDTRDNYSVRERERRDMTTSVERTSYIVLLYCMLVIDEYLMS